MRTYTDPAGIEWRVWKVVPEFRIYVERRQGERRGGASDRYSGEERRREQERRRADIQAGWLCFDSDAERRRLFPVPPDWETCSEERLELFRRVAKLVLRPTEPPPLAT